MHFKTNINNVTPRIQLLADDFDIKFFPIHHFSVWQCRGGTEVSKVIRRVRSIY